MRRVSEETPESSRIMLGLLDAVEQNRAQSQRLLASELGIALGLVNAYLKRCIKKGLVKVRSAPARRYAYYLTPQGFAEKSRLTVDYLSYSFSFFRQAKTDCSELFKTASDSWRGESPTRRPERSGGNRGPLCDGTWHQDRRRRAKERHGSRNSLGCRYLTISTPSPHHLTPS